MVSESGQVTTQKTSMTSPSALTIEESRSSGSTTTSAGETTRRVRCRVLWTTSSIAAIGCAAYTVLITADDHWSIYDFVTASLFPILFGWIAFSFGLAREGHRSLGHEIRLGAERSKASRVTQSSNAQPPSAHALVTDSLAPSGSALPDTDRDATTVAVLMPVYNESPTRVLAGVAAMCESLRNIESLSQFEFYILSDSTRPEVWLDEQWHWEQLRRNFPDAAIHYRHRPENTCRKSGNIADFCRRWGARHEHMIVLDADSLIEGDTMVEMTRRVRKDPTIGILQAPPRPVGRSSLFARLQQFSSWLYGPLFARGYALWSADQGNYWGHNAIIRVEAFCDHCELPKLSGRGPLGGEILSHDFVEAALMVRNGYRVVLADDLDGSFEECPTTLMDYAIRDQRWCQGNLQHSKVLASAGFDPISRTHFIGGLMSYVASPIWMAFTMVSILGFIVQQLSSRPTSDPMHVLAISLFVFSMALLLLPKFFALHVSRRRGPGFLTNVRGALLEMGMSVLLSPIMAICHTKFVLSTLCGWKVRWNAQQRDESGLSLTEAITQHWTTTLLGVAVAAGLYALSPGLLAWFSPLLLGLWFSIPLAMAMASTRFGKWLRQRGWLLIPEESQPPAVVRWADIWSRKLGALSAEPRDLFERLIDDPKFLSMHVGILDATDSDRPLASHQRKAIEAGYAAGGIEKVPGDMIRGMLGDGELLKKLHLGRKMSGIAATISP